MSATVLGVMALVATGTGIWMRPEAWGALGQWAGAAGTVLAVAAALRIANTQAGAEAARQRAQDRDREMEQAGLVFGQIVYPPPDQPQDGPDVVRIVNHSDKQIFYPRLEGFTHQNDGTTTWLIDDTDPRLGEYPGPREVLRGGETDSVPVRIRYEPELVPDVDYPLKTKPIIGFTDALGRRWRRIGADAPTRVQAHHQTNVGGPDWYRFTG